MEEVHQKKKIDAKEEKVIFYNKGDLLLTKTSIYQLCFFLVKWFSYQQLTCVKRISKFLQIGLENGIQFAFVFTLLNGSTY